MKDLLRRIWYILNRRRMEREMADEMEYHRELMAADGRSDFGNDLRLREVTRDVWGWSWFDRLGQDLTYGWRVLRNSPGFTVTAMLVLALGIGVPLTAFRAVMSDVTGGSAPDPDTLVQLTRRAPGMHITVLPYPELAFYAANARSFRQVIGMSTRSQGTFGETAAGSMPESIHLSFVTANYFAEFGITAAYGRLWTREDDERPESEAVALIGEQFWKRRLGGAEVIGHRIRINGKIVRVVGVLPRSVKTTDEIWMPLVKQPYVIEGSTLLTDWNSELDLYARLIPGVSPKAAEQETLALAARLREAHPDNVQQGEYLDTRPIQKLDSNSPEFQIMLTAAGMVVLLLVAACANLGTLVLARGVTREREIRLRMALGAARQRVVRQLFTESLLLAILSALCGLLLSSIVLKVIQLEHNSTSSLVPDWRVLCATFGVALLAALVFGLPPALRLTSLVPRAGRARTIFLTLQVAASFLLLVVSGLLVSGLGRLGSIDPGFDYQHLVWISPGLKAHGYGAATAQAYLSSLRARALELPDVKAASEVWLGPWSNTRMGAQWRGHDLTGNHVDPQVPGSDGNAVAARAELPRRGRGRDNRHRSYRASVVARGRRAWKDDSVGRSRRDRNRSGA